MNYWILKSEPDEFGIDDLAAADNQVTAWTGVRNFQARNHLRAMKSGDKAFFYHSSCAIPGIAGSMEVIREHYPDPTQFDPESDYYDPKSISDDPRWSAVDFQFRNKAINLLTLDQLRQMEFPDELIILRRGNRLSVTPATAKQWALIKKAAKL